MKRALILAAIMAPALLAQSPDKYGFVQTNVKPAEAGVFVDGKYMGPSSLFSEKGRAIRVRVGTHRVEIVAPYHHTIVADFQLAENQYHDISRTMKPTGKAPKKKVSAIITEGFGEAAVYVDNEYFGHAGRELRVKPGKFMLKISGMDGTILRELKVELANRETLVLPKDGAPVVRRIQ